MRVLLFITMMSLISNIISDKSNEVVFSASIDGTKQTYIEIKSKRIGQ